VPFLQARQEVVIASQQASDGKAGSVGDVPTVVAAPVLLHSPFPGVQSVVVGHSLPVPDLSCVFVNIRSAEASHFDVQADQVPRQSLFNGHNPTPGWQSFVVGHALPVPDLA